MNNDIIIIGYADGSCEPQNPGGVVGYGWWMDWQGEDVEEFAIAFSGGTFATNNIAEFIAVEALLMEVVSRAWSIAERVDKKLIIRGDSQLVIQVLNGEWSARKPHLRPIAAILNMLKDKLVQAGWTVIGEQIPREQNQRADKLSRRALNEIEKDRASLTEKLGEEYYL